MACDVSPVAMFLIIVTSRWMWISPIMLHDAIYIHETVRWKVSAITCMLNLISVLTWHGLCTHFCLDKVPCTAAISIWTDRLTVSLSSSGLLGWIFMKTMQMGNHFVSNWPFCDRFCLVQLKLENQLGTWRGPNILEPLCLFSKILETNEEGQFC